MRYACLAVTAFIASCALPQICLAQDSLANVSKASGDSAVAVAELTESGVKVVAGAVALPFVAVGTVAESAGGAVRDSGQAVWDSANGPLAISPETVTAQPAPDVPYDRDDRSRRDDRRDRDDRGDDARGN